MAIAEPLEPTDSATSQSPASISVSKAKRSSFYMAMRVLPEAQREAMFDIYSFCREVDDIADDGGCRTLRRAELDLWRARIDALYPGLPAEAPLSTTGSVLEPMPRLAATIERFGLFKEDFVAVIDGMQMDLDADIQAPDFETLDLYCDRVASAVGRLSTQVFGIARPEGVKLAHHLGRALQFTNILRDLDEDADINRLYLSHESLAGAGIEERTPYGVLAAPGLPRACDWLAHAAREHYDQSDALMRELPSRAVRAPRLMSVVYRDILEKTIARGWQAPRDKVKLPKARLLWLMMRYGFF